MSNKDTKPLDVELEEEKNDADARLQFESYPKKGICVVKIEHDDGTIELEITQEQIFLIQIELSLIQSDQITPVEGSSELIEESESEDIF